MPRSLPHPDSPAARLMHGRDWSGEDVTGWLMSEKLDGVRALWWPAAAGGTGELLSRTGRPFAAPDWWLAGLPDVPLDGELWLGRGRFEETRATCQSSRDPERWRELRLHAFDLPTADVLLPASRRLRLLERARAPRVVAVPQVECRGSTHLLQTLDEISEAGGEGLVVVEPNSRYSAGRGWGVLKVKPSSVERVYGDRTILEFVRRGLGEEFESLSGSLPS